MRLGRFAITTVDGFDRRLWDAGWTVRRWSPLGLELLLYWRERETAPAPELYVIVYPDDQIEELEKLYREDANV